MQPILRKYQADCKTDILVARHDGAENVLLELPTGAGKTVIFASMLNEHNGAACSIAHRQELVKQQSLALAANGVRHRLIAPVNVVRHIVNAHIKKYGQSYVNSSAMVGVAGVDTLRLRKTLGPWFNQVTFVVQDEGHHVLQENKWGKAGRLFPNAWTLGVTATPVRADGKGLGSHADGVYDAIVSGPGMRELIRQGYLTEYRVFAPAVSDLDLSEVKIGSTGDYTRDGLTVAVRESHIVGDVVEHYERIAPGKLGITFTTDVQTAQDIADAYNAAGVPAAMVCAKTGDKDRTSLIDKFERREILQLVNVDLFGEGFDCPAIEVVSFARPTESYAVYAQQFGRALRPMEGKHKAIIIDHVGNVFRHGFPDAPHNWTLDRRARRSNGLDEGVIPIKVCAKCTRAYEAIFNRCPYCGFKAVPTDRSRIEFVDGDLLELDAETLAAMRGEKEKIDMDPEDYRRELEANGARPEWVGSHVKRHVGKQNAQAALRESIAWWAGYLRTAGAENSEIYRRFYFMFGVDVLTANALGTREALRLMVKINRKMGIG